MRDPVVKVFQKASETGNLLICGIIGMQLDFDSWKYLGNKTCEFKFFEYPKKYL